MTEYIVHVKTDEAGSITAGNSGTCVHGADGWTEMDRGVGLTCHHAQGNDLPSPLRDECVYCCTPADGVVQGRTASGMDAGFAARPTQEVTDVELLLVMAAEHEYRLCLMELGVTEDDL